ncbi:MAG: hypothetical protein QGH19_01555 [Candidatus Woesearchaeota archaeon]|jgi:hypothetical protein|nr:hypothetical protein [Candidatus Woesearchaeota archaeon]|tara:strand:+ start:1917 stop:2324 length:408 start_codon:yes stop_codon:yes gene_type:complete
MAVVGFNFIKINAERKPVIKGEIKINNNVSVKDVETHEIHLGKTKQEGLKVSFEFTSKYEPSVGEIKLLGEVIFLEESRKIKEIHDAWKKDKKLPKEILTSILNNVLGRCNIQAMVLSRDVNLPPPLPLPKVQSK